VSIVVFKYLILRGVDRFLWSGFRDRSNIIYDLTDVIKFVLCDLFDILNNFHEPFPALLEHDLASFLAPMRSWLCGFVKV